MFYNYRPALSLPFQFNPLFYSSNSYIHTFEYNNFSIYLLKAAAGEIWVFKQQSHVDNWIQLVYNDYQLYITLIMRPLQHSQIQFSSKILNENAILLRLHSLYLNW
jgi:hypothetical protein